jgi:hypothetical protein
MPFQVGFSRLGQSIADVGYFRHRLPGIHLFKNSKPEKAGMARLNRAMTGM